MAENQISHKGDPLYTDEFVDSYIWDFEDDPVGAEPGEGIGLHGLNDNVRNLSGAINDLHGTEFFGLQAILSNGNAVIGTGQTVDITVPYACDLKEVQALADQTGSITVVVTKASYTDFSSTFSAVSTSPHITLSSVEKTQNTNLAGASWSVSLDKGDILRFEVTGTPVNIIRLLISFKILRKE